MSAISTVIVDVDTAEAGGGVSREEAPDKDNKEDNNEDEDKDKDNKLGLGGALTGATARRSQQPLKS
jgi:hypothetical protein